jgi:hypothetical protein
MSDWSYVSVGQHFQFNETIAWRMRIGARNLISQQFAIEITIRDRYTKFLPAAFTLMNVVVMAQVSGIFCILPKCQDRSFTVSGGGLMVMITYSSDDYVD